MKASFHHTPATCRTAFELVTSGRFKCAEYITGRAGLDEVPAIFAGMMHRNGSARDIKTAVFPAGGRGERHDCDAACAAGGSARVPDTVGAADSRRGAGLVQGAGDVTL
ncbi:hypothetical protein [Tunturiibacter empetritectus]|uniref:hypothetical protein n=1 Tax=Tunturiibacter empetritectus TaxID=3069691 RepID=UPI003D9B2806